MFGFKRKVNFMDYDEYKERIDALDTFLFQQKVRHQSISNMRGVGQ